MPNQSERLANERRRFVNRAAIDAVDWPHDDVKSIIANAIRDYKGNLEVLSSAIGCMFLCMYMGRRVMQVVYTPKTIQKYQRILGNVKFKDLPFIPDTTPNSERSIGYMWAMSLESFWDVVKGTKHPQNDIVSGVDVLPEL